MIIRSQEDAKIALIEARKKYGTWENIENKWPEIAGKLAETDSQKLNKWYQSIENADDYFNKAIDYILTDSRLITEKAHYLWLIDLLKMAYEEIIGEEENRRIDEAQKEIEKGVNNGRNYNIE